MTSIPNYPSGTAPMAGGGVPPRMAPPAEVLTSVKLWFASIIVGLVGGILVFALTDQGASVQTMMETNPGALTESQLQTAVTVGLAVGLVVALIILGLELLFVLKMKAGRNWARIVLAVLAGVSALSSLVGLTSGFSMGTAINFVSLVLLIAAVVYMFRPATKAYFSQPRA